MNRPVSAAAVGALLLGALVIVPAAQANTPPVASERHARCGLQREISGVEISNQQVNNDILNTEPPPRDLVKLGCYDQIKGVMAGITAFGSLPGPVSNLLSSFACTAVQSSQAAIRERFESFAGTGFGQAFNAINGAPLPMVITPSSFLSAPPAAVNVVNDPRFAAGATGPGAQNTLPSLPSLPQGSTTNIFQGGQ